MHKNKRKQGKEQTAILYVSVSAGREVDRQMLLLSLKPQLNTGIQSEQLRLTFLLYSSDVMSQLSDQEEQIHESSAPRDVCSGVKITQNCILISETDLSRNHIHCARHGERKFILDLSSPKETLQLNSMKVFRCRFGLYSDPTSV